MDGRGNQRSSQCGEEMSKNCPLSSQKQQEQVSWMARVEEREEDKGARGLLSRLEPPTGTKGVSLVPVGASNRDKRPWPPYPLPSPPPEPFSSLVLAVLGSGEGSSCSFLHHICEDLWFPRPSIGAKGLGLVFLFFHCLCSSFHALEIEKMCSSFLGHLDCICRCDFLLDLDEYVDSRNF